MLRVRQAANRLAYLTRVCVTTCHETEAVTSLRSTPKAASIHDELISYAIQRIIGGLEHESRSQAAAHVTQKRKRILKQPKSCVRHASRNDRSSI